MKNLAKFVALGAMFASATLAHAGSGTGTLNIVGLSGSLTTVTSFGSPVTSITFDTNSSDYNEQTGNGNGIYNTTVGNVNVARSSFVLFTPTFNFTGGLGTSTTTLASPEELFQLTVSGVLYYFDVESFVLTTGGNPSVYFYGTLDTVLGSGTGAANSFSLTPQIQNDGSFAANLANPPLSPAPEPSSLILLGTGLASAAGIMFRKRKAVQV